MSAATLRQRTAAWGTVEPQLVPHPDFTLKYATMRVGTRQEQAPSIFSSVTFAYRMRAQNDFISHR